MILVNRNLQSPKCLKMITQKKQIYLEHAFFSSLSMLAQVAQVDNV